MIYTLVLQIYNKVKATREEVQIERERESKRVVQFSCVICFGKQLAYFPFKAMRWCFLLKFHFVSALLFQRLGVRRRTALCAPLVLLSCIKFRVKRILLNHRSLSSSIYYLIKLDIYVSLPDLGAAGILRKSATKIRVLHV